jgi:MATE family multidrug resistance protein
MDNRVTHLQHAPPVNASLATEIRANLRLAFPIIGAQLAAVGMSTVDTIFAGRLGAGALAAVAVGTNISVVFLVFFLGMFMACSPIVAQRAGAGAVDAGSGGFVRRTLLLAVGLGLLWTAGMHAVAAPAMARLHLAPETAALGVAFMRALAWAGAPMCVGFALRFCAEGLGQTRPILFAGLVGLGANIVLDWALLYGHLGLPALGAVGCGWATAVSASLMAAALALAYLRVPRLAALRLFARSAMPPAHSAMEVLTLGLPIGLILLAEAGLFSTAALLMARFGEVAVGAYQIALNIAAVLFMIPLGVGLATTVRVGDAIGAGDAALATHRGRTGMMLALVNAASNSLIMIVAGGVLVRLYTDQAEVGAQAMRFLLLAAAFQFFDGLQVASNGALRGIKDTRVPMLITVGAYWLVGFPVMWLLSTRTALGASGIWWGLTAALAAAALGLSLRFLSKAPRVN